MSYRVKDWLIMRLKDEPREDWVQIPCPVCGRPVWDWDPSGATEARLREVCTVWKMCGNCSDSKRGVQSRLWEDDAM